MYIAGHEEILRLALEDAPAPRDADRLADGLRYPDLPCAERVFVGGRVLHVDYKPCDVSRMRHLIGPLGNRVREIYLSHKGPLAIMHAMTPDVSARRAAVRDAMVREAVVMFRLALRDDVHAWRRPAPNAFWLGQVLHMVADSYSPAHTLRLGTREKPGDTAAARRRRALAEPVRQGRAHELLLAIFDALQRDVAPAYVRAAHRRMPEQDAAFEAWVKERLLRAIASDAAADVVARFVRTDAGSRLLFDLFEVAVFRLQQARRFRALLRPGARRGATPGAHPIVEFRDYARQSQAFHARYDLISYVRKYGLLEPVVRDTRFVLRLYDDALKAGARGLVDGPRALRAYLERVTLALS